jgi:nucleotide-binding universal stress UspA family protein
MTIRTALVPLDGSETAEMILPLAATAASALDLELVLLEVVTAPRGDSVATEQALADAARYLDDVAASLRDGPAVQTHACFASDSEVAGTIARVAEQTRAELIVLATHGRTRSRRWAMGSVADAVVRAAACPVLILRGDATHTGGPIERILLAVDGSTTPELLPAVSLADAFAAVLDLVLVLSPCAGLDAVPLRWARSRLEGVAATYLQEPASRAPAGHTVERHVLHGPAAPELLYYAECSGADLIVVGTGGRFGPDGATLGGLTTELLCAGRLPVLLL